MASDLKNRVQEDLNAARKRREKDHVLVLSTLLSEIRNKEIESGTSLGDEDVVEVVSRAIKQRKDASDQMRTAGRDELAAREDRQAEILSAYLPQALGEDEVRAMIRDAIAAGVDQMGGVMGRLMPQIRGRFDGKDANRLVREELERS